MVIKVETAKCSGCGDTIDLGIDPCLRAKATGDFRCACCGPEPGSPPLGFRCQCGDCNEIVSDEDALEQMRARWIEIHGQPSSLQGDATACDQVARAALGPS